MITKRDLLAGALKATALAAGGALLPLRGAGAADAPKGAPNDAPKEFRVGYQKASGILVAARRQQVLERRLKELGVERVSWVEFQFGPPLLEALGAGVIDIGTVGDTPPIFAQAAGVGLLYVASTPATPGAILVQKDSPIRSVADLKGRKVAFGKGSSAHNVVIQALKKAGLSYADIEPVYLGPADAAAAFASGKVDAWSIWDPYWAIAELRQSARPIITTADGLASHSFYLASKATVERHPAVIQSVLDGLREVTAWASSHRDELAALSTEVTGVPIDAQKIATQRYPLALNPLSDADVRQQQEIADTFFELGLIPRKIAVKDVVWTGRPS